jgi:FkbM family methyltransferase
MSVRDDTSDLAVVGATMTGVAGSGYTDEYRLRDIHIDGRFVDVGAHIGAVTVAVLLDNPEATALCVEPVPENVDVLRANLALNGLEDRATVIVGAVGTDVIAYGDVSSEFASTNRYISNMVPSWPGNRLEVRRIDPGDLLPAAFIKTDCEGGEWALLAHPKIASVPIIVGEWHGTFEGKPGDDRIRDVLSATHDVECISGRDNSGGFWAVQR